MLKIDKIVSSTSIKERAAYLREQAVFAKHYQGKHSDFLFDIINS